MRALTKAVATDVAASSSMNLRTWRKDRMWWADALQMLSTCWLNVKPLSIVTPKLFALVRVPTVVSANDTDGFRSSHLNLAPVPSEKDCFRLLRIKRQSVLGKPGINSVSTILQSFNGLVFVQCDVQLSVIGILKMPDSMWCDDVCN